jgi:hypothetical protein
MKQQPKSPKEKVFDVILSKEDFDLYVNMLESYIATINKIKQDAFASQKKKILEIIKVVLGKYHYGCHPKCRICGFIRAKKDGI